VIHGLHHLAGVHAAQVGEELEAEVGVVVELGHDRDDITRADSDLGLVVALADRAGEAVPEVRFEPRLEATIH
jgi:hypothetical protein